MSQFSRVHRLACLHRDENAERRQAMWVCPEGTAAGVSADRAPAPSAASPPNSWNFYQASSLGEAALGPPCSPPPADGKHGVDIYALGVSSHLNSDTILEVLFNAFGILSNKLTQWLP